MNKYKRNGNVFRDIVAAKARIASERYDRTCSTEKRTRLNGVSLLLTMLIRVSPTEKLGNTECIQKMSKLNRLSSS